MDDLGFPLPYQLMCALFGLPKLKNTAELRTWTWRSLRLIDAFLTPEEIADGTESSIALHDYISAVVSWKRDNLGDDLMSAVISASDNGALSPDQLVPYLQTLYLAGMHTTVHQVALSLLALLRNRSQWELLQSHPDLLDGAVEELLRYDPTAQYMKRSPGGPVQIGGVSIPVDAEILAWIGSANRDEVRWGPTAANLDITRSDARQHIAFGKGPHTCVGLWLARMELQVVLSTIIFVTKGALLALVVWLVASIALAFYVANFGSYNKTYGTLGGVIGLLVWVWLTNVAILLGMEVNSERERNIEMGEGDTRAEREIQLQPRDAPKPQQTT